MMVLELTGLTHLQPPVEFASLTQVVIGASIGTAFSGTRPRELAKTFFLSSGLTLSLLAFSGLCLRAPSVDRYWIRCIAVGLCTRRSGRDRDTCADTEYRPGVCRVSPRSPGVANFVDGAVTGYPLV